MKLSAKQIAVVYHSKDIDGILSGILLSNFFSIWNDNLDNSVTTIPYNYESSGYDFLDEPEKFIKKFDVIIFVDVTPPKEWVEFYSNLDGKKTAKKKMIIIDHHENRLQDIFHVFSTNKQYYHTDELEGFKKFPKELTPNYIHNKNIETRSYTKLSTFNSVDIYYSILDYKDIAKYTISAVMLTYYFIHYLINETSNYYKSIETNMSEFMILPVKETEKLLWNLVELVGEYDVWNFDTPGYPEQLKERIICFQLEINDIIHKEKDDRGKYEIINKLLFLSPAFGYKLEHHINNGNLKYLKRLKYIENISSILELKYKQHGIRKKQHQFLMIIGEYPDYIIQDYLRKKYEDNKHFISAFIFIRFDNEKDVAKVSVRQCHDKKFDCIEFVKLYTINNGGGHYAAAGGGLKLSKFFTQNMVLFE